MSLYIALTHDFPSRQCENLLCPKEKCWALSSKKGKALVFLRLENLIEDTLGLLKHLYANKISEAEVFLESNEPQLEESFASILDSASNYLLDKDLSVGLVLDDPNLIEENIDAIVSFGITLPHQKADFLPQESLEFAPACAAIGDGEIKPRKKVFAPLPNSRGNLHHVDCCAASIPLQESFHSLLMGHLRKSKRSNAEIYRRGGISKQVFSKIISSSSLIPTKGTIICLALALELSLEETKELLESAGYALSRSLLFDSIVLRHIAQGNYDLDAINAELYDCDCPLLGWHPRED